MKPVKSMGEGSLRTKLLSRGSRVRIAAVAPMNIPLPRFGSVFYFIKVCNDDKKLRLPFTIDSSLDDFVIRLPVNGNEFLYHLILN